ncbi:MAG: trypsin-like peptidase domain-containing protein, partial [Clostridia bacterium]|nr:trypsin-like peptidase domain-containing protein [Clostridia bacterium]
PPERPERKSRGKKSSRRLVAVALCCSLLGGFVGAGSTLMLQSLQREEQRQNVSNILEGNREATVLQTTVVDTGRLLTAAEVYAQNVNSTVGITTSVTTNFWGYQTTAAAAGSGFILSDDGYILTNYHVIENASAITVTQFDGTKHNAVLIGFDQSLDIAVLKIEATGLSPVILGDSQQLNVGDSVVAIGNPLGELTFSLTSGAVSALERSVTLQNGVTMELIQTDCAINSGNSGGALFNLYGEVIGITNAKYSGHGSSSEASIDNIGFAIPVNSVRSIVESIIEKGYIAKPFIGVTVDNVSEEVLSYGLPAGAAVRSVVEDSPAEQAGLKVGDIITAVDELAIDSAQELTERIRETLPGDVVSLTVYRRGETLTILVTVGEQVQSATEVPSQQNPTQIPQGGQQPYSFNPFDFFDGFGFGFN